MSVSSRKTGRVKFFNSQKGYGFIIPEDAGPDPKIEEIFVHHTAIHNDGGFKSLAEGEEVEYDLVQGPKGMQAANVSGPNGSAVRGDPNAGRRNFEGYATGNNGRFNAFVPAYANLSQYGAGANAAAPYGVSTQGGYPYSPSSTYNQAFAQPFTQPTAFPYGTATGGGLGGLGGVSQQGSYVGSTTPLGYGAAQASYQQAFSQFGQAGQGGNGGYGYGQGQQ